MPKTIHVKLSPKPSLQAGDYMVVTCPKCGKKTYGVAGQKGKKCPVCRHSYPMPPGEDAPRFTTPEAACRFIQAEEAKRAGRLDFAPVASGFRPASCAPVIARTNKIVSEAKTLEAQFSTWVRSYFLTATGSISAGLPTNVVVAAAAKAGFPNADKLIEKAVHAGLLFRPKPYSIWAASSKDNKN